MTAYNLEVPDEIWKVWKLTVPRDVDLNTAIVQMMQERIEKEGGR